MNKSVLIPGIVMMMITTSAILSAQKKNEAKAPTGNYGCVVVGGDQYIETGGFQLQSDGKYKPYTGDVGHYSYEPSTQSIRFVDGHYAGSDLVAIYYATGPVKGGIPSKADPVIVLKPKKKTAPTGMGHTEIQYCYKQAEAPKKRTPPAVLPKSH